MTVEAPGFKKTIRPNLTLAMSGQLKIDIQLEVGAVNESITISAESPILDTSTVTTGKALTTREIMDLPIMTNDIVLLARVAPGVVNQGTTQFLTQGMVGGDSGFFAPLSALARTSGPSTERRISAAAESPSRPSPTRSPSSRSRPPVSTLPSGIPSG